MNNELLDALTILEKEKNISKETLLEAIENSLLTACKNHFGKADNVKVVIDPDTCEYHCAELFAECPDDQWKIYIGRYRSGRSKIQGIWPYCNTECQERDLTEDS